MNLRFLIIDGYPAPARDKLRDAGMLLASELYVRMLLAAVPDAEYDVYMPCDPGTEVPRPLPDYDGILWTGTNVTIYHLHDANVTNMIELGKAGYTSGTPQFGTCWGIQMAAVAAGGKVAKNPRGREMGIARKISLNNAGRQHAFMNGKPAVFDAFISHYDEVVEVPEGGEVLAGNDFTGIQALVVQHNGGAFWAVQYHPEYDLGEMARLTVARTQRLLNEDFAKDQSEIDALVAKMEALAAEPQRKDLRWQLSIDDDVLDAGVRQAEFRNYIDKLVRPTAKARRTS
jgi:GMP synthase (glutamine-hydrolysing)